MKNLKINTNENTEGLVVTNTKVQELTSQLTKSTAASSIGKIPVSCGDLHQIGHKKSGLYSVMGSKQVENVYCDFTKPTGDAGLQKWIGYANVKSTLVYFYALRNSAFDEANVPIPFQSEKINMGGGMNLSTGKFTAPV
ncbi:uncharacterized protein LOC124196719 isoform X2 [Daphnia pulex]|uniref:uncharacterized protein LOC124196719 isoform X2 n=1 Tax=Daphnia pulex TaxID=6669 RepID=UPI001EDECD05|nr:uncharacterized protein LOC124196719 isoform X2 [Daphnia pulex]XP_046447851.1 uncharacterized protein LOC124196719 isoform X2 [Daphnia pulex]